MTNSNFELLLIFIDVYGLEHLLMAKYCSHAHPGMVIGSVGVSPTWRRMLHVQDLAKQHIRFIVRSGDSNFWFDNWLGSGPFFYAVR